MSAIGTVTRDAVDDAAEHVAAELVGAEQVVPATGPARSRTFCASGLSGAISGAKIAIRIQATAITAPDRRERLAARARPSRASA